MAGATDVARMKAHASRSREMMPPPILAMDDEKLDAVSALSTHPYLLIRNIVEGLQALSRTILLRRG